MFVCYGFRLQIRWEVIFSLILGIGQGQFFLFLMYLNCNVKGEGHDLLGSVHTNDNCDGAGNDSLFSMCSTKVVEKEFLRW